MHTYCLKHTMIAVISLAIFLVAPAAALNGQQKSTQPPNPTGMNAASADRQLFFCTTRIEAFGTDGKIHSTGTGFLFDYSTNQQVTIPFVVTCKHVVAGLASASLSFVPNKNDTPDLGNKCEFTLTNLQSSVFYDPDPTIDVALLPLLPILRDAQTNTSKPFYRTLGIGLVPDENASADLSAIQPIVFMGYPYGLRDSVNLLPLARRGFTASPYVVDFNGLPFF